MNEQQALIEFSKRFNEALDEAKLLSVPAEGEGRQKYIGKIFGVGQKGARKWLKGETYPRKSRLHEICVKLGVNADWLMYGLGPKHPHYAGPDDVNEVAAALHRRYEAADLQTKTIINMCLGMPPDERVPESVSQTLKSMIDTVRLLLSNNLKQQ